MIGAIRNKAAHHMNEIKSKPSSISIMTLNSSSRKQMSHKTSRLIQQLESDIHHNMASPPKSSTPSRSAEPEPLRRSPRLAKKRAMSWRQLEATMGESAKQSTLKRSSSAKSSSETKCTPRKRAVVDPKVAISPWGLPKSTTSNSKDEHSRKLVDPKLDLSPLCKKLATKQATPLKASSSRVKFTSDTVIVEAKSLRKNVRRLTPHQKKRSESRGDYGELSNTRTPTAGAATPISFGLPSPRGTPFSSLKADDEKSPHAFDDGAPAFPMISSPAIKSINEPSFSIGETPSCNMEEEKCFEEMRLEHHFAKHEAQPTGSTIPSQTSSSLDFADTNEEGKEQDVPIFLAGFGLETQSTTPIKWSPIRSSKPLALKFNNEQNEEKQVPAAAPVASRVKFASDVVFNTSSNRVRKNTPHKRNSTMTKFSRVTTMSSPARAKKTSLLQTGAVRMTVVYHTNPRKLAKGGTRIVDSGAIRKVVTRHTTPRKLIGNRNMWLVYLD